ncbi:aminoacyl-tRNA deacylase [Oligoflexus tunisiensis]|uniref:aminoacyl-tRNA deacylase n=1 Tax=Oligoflexus tunisiensis TaxID=708132 RepID=UPI00114CACA5
MTLAVRQLLAEKVAFTPHLYTYEEKGGTAVSARELQVAEHAVIKTLIMEDEQKRPLIVLMHGDRQVSTKELARHLKVKTISPCKPEVADRHSGYQVGGTSPFGTRRKMPVYYEASMLALDKVYINGGKRGFLLGMNPYDIIRILQAEPVQVAIP